jgi:hydroxypyruvate isomerase
VAGFDGVELQFPYAESAGALHRAARRAELPVILINAPILPSYPSGLAGRPEMRDRFRSQIPQIVEYAEALDVRYVHVMAGRCDTAQDLEQCRDVYRENLLLATEALAPRGVGVLIEALNPIDVPDYLVGTLAEAINTLKRCQNQVRLQFDAYHVTRMGLDATVELGRLLPVTGHVQFADAPGRHEPGTGVVNFIALLALLKNASYSGWLGAEYVPAAETQAGLAWLGKWRDAMVTLV